MASPTKLYQRAGSPLIHGRSRYERRFALDWVVGSFAGLVALYTIHGITTLLNPSTVRVNSPAGMVRWLAPMLPGVLGMLPGSAGGVWVARLFGWRAAWLAGAVVGTALGVALLFARRSIG